MQTLSLALRSRGEEGEKLPDVFGQLAELGVHFRRGWLHLIAAAPGAGKSALASFLALNTDETGNGDYVPMLYCSPDNDVITWGKNALALATQSHVNDAERRLVANDEEAYDTLDQRTGHLWVSFQAAPTPLDIREELDAFATVWGDWPGMLIIDNLLDLSAADGGPDERTSQDAVLDFLKRIARETGTAVVVLCHVTGAHTDGLTPIPRSGIQNKLDKRPQLILTLFRVNDNVLGVSVVKNRSGRANADGSLFAQIPWIPEMGWLGVSGGEL